MAIRFARGEAYVRIRQGFLRALGVVALATTFSACDDAGIDVTDAAVGCGNGVVDTGEQCDDGNTTSGDGCSSTCQTETPDPECGNGMREGNEECDDGNVVDGDGCSSTCTGELAPFCGDGTVDAGEECDDSNNVDGDGCDAGCVIEVGPACGDGTVDDGEGCDDGNVVDGDGCSATCVIEPFCGDGNVDDGEGCDDGNNDDNDGCNATCQIETPVCGNTFIEEGEACDDGNVVNGDGCDSTCQLEPFCGDGNLDEGEECDDGNLVDGDGCDLNCDLETTCGDGELEAGEECDDNNTDAGDGCDADCQFEPAVCGDGILQNGETCDDGNVAQADGCSPDCLEEIPCIILDDCDAGQFCARGFCVDEEPPVVCGDGLIEGDETCDDGNADPGDLCDENCQIEIPDPVCGNMILELGELCDDGNLVNGDGCNDQCLIEACGNGLIELGEECDDGNLDAGDGCDANCVIERICGNGLLTDDEQCDDGNVEPGDGCDALCQIEPECGNNMVEPGEECDDGNLDPDDGCSPECVLDIVCGNGVRQVGETCDDGNLLPLDGCDANCQVEDGFIFPLAPEGECVQVGGAIDDMDAGWARPGLLNGDPCAFDNGDNHFYEVFRFVNAGLEPQFINATSAWSGDGYLHIFDENFDAATPLIGCLTGDDDFAANGAGATLGSQIEGFEVAAGQTFVLVASTYNANAAIGNYGIDVCSIPPPARCGDGIVQEDNGEECDDGNNVDEDGCSALCQRDPICGDGFVDGEEECDDSNLDLGDGCDADCQREPVCGDGFVDDPEQCDDGNVDAGDGCDANCVFESECGNGVIEGLEQCDDSNIDAGDGCDADCALEQPDALPIAERGLTIDIEGALEEGDFLWARPFANCAGSNPGRAFDFYRVVNNTGVDQQLTVTAAWGGDSFLHVFSDPFNPTASPDGCIVGNDDFPNTTGSRVVDVDIAAGQTLVIVASGFGAGAFTGPYSIEVLTQHVCGDNLLGEGVEECDDGNLDNGDGCTDACLIEAVCGDNEIGRGEECDDGNVDAGDGCDAACQIERICGNGLVSDDEECDDGNLDNGDGCDENCVIEPACGDGELDEGEECDDGNILPLDGCDPLCQIERVCGNGQLSDDEQCEDGNILPGDGCGPLCALEDGPLAIAQPDGAVFYAGELDDQDPQWVRPFADCDPDGVVADHYYETQVIVNTTGADQAVRLTGMWPEGDGYIHAFTAPFDPEVLDNCIEGDDDFFVAPGPGARRSRVERVPIADGEMLVIVSSTFSGGAAIGPYSVEVYTLPICGDGVAQGDEACDDGNADNADGCTDTCEIGPICGDENVDAPEGCDDGNREDGDGCDANCQFEAACGNGNVDAGEQCDDGNLEAGDGCDAACAIEQPDALPIAPRGEAINLAGALQAGDLTWDRPNAACQPDNRPGRVLDFYRVTNNTGADQMLRITAAWGGDSYLHVFTDPFDPASLDGCIIGDDDFNGLNGSQLVDIAIADGQTLVIVASAFGAAPTGDYTIEVFTQTVCGDGEVQGDETCDDANEDDADGCNNVCQIGPLCGDGNVEDPEACDDGARADGDGCDANCQFEVFCGNLNVDEGEECDDGNAEVGDGCDALCQREPVCGDGFIDAPEQCDDENVVDGDGCDANCMFEQTCGNGVREGTEQCDDGNLLPLDGCDLLCNLEQPLPLPIAPRGQAINVDGALEDTDFTWNRPDAACNTGDRAGRFFDFYRVTNLTGADQQLRITAAWGGDSYLHVYTDPFDPTDVNGCVIGNDDFPNITGSRLIDVDIDAGETIVVVASTFAAAPTGDYAIEIFTQHVCGDNLLGEGVEECDDGNLDDGDGCDATCLIEQECGNGDIEGTETCDDGNTDAGDGCDADCAIEEALPIAPRGEAVNYVGNIDDQDAQWARPSAACGATVGADHFFETQTIVNNTGVDQAVRVTAAWSGDGYLHAFTMPFDPAMLDTCVIGDDDFEVPPAVAGLGSRIETVDIPAGSMLVIVASTFSANAAIGAYSVEVFTLPVCGDGEVHGNEACDDQNDDDADGCTSACQVGPVCGDGNVEDPEACDDGLRLDGDGCDANCQFEVFCGNGNVDEGEQCDDGGILPGDGCDPLCQREPACGDGFVDDGEACDDGNLENGDGCSDACAFEQVCGNNVVEGTEICDDGNLANGDGCDAVCTPEVIAFVQAIDQRGNATAEGQNDDYTFTVDHTQSTVRVTTTGCDAASDTTIGIFPVNEDGTLGNRIAFNDDIEPGVNTCSRLTTILDAGNYLIRVRGFLGRAIARYSIDYRLETNVTAGGDYDGALAVEGTDLFVFDLAADGRAILETSDGADGCPGDTVMNLYPIDVDGNRGAVISDDDGGTGACSLLDRDLTAGRYEVEINEHPFGGNVAIEAYVLTVQFPACGNGAIEGDEACDDGNNVDGDGCAADCTIEPGCGNGQLDLGEFCDDGNLENGDGCDENCVIEIGCGNGVVELLEECDDGNNENGDGCDENCASEVFAIAPRGESIDLVGSIDDQDPTWNRPNAACAGNNLGRFYETRTIVNTTGADQAVRITATWGDDGYLHAYTVPFDAEDRANCIIGDDDFIQNGAEGALGSRIETVNIPDGQQLVIVASTFAANAAIGDYTIEVFTLPVCGDNVVSAGEECDDGNNDDGDGCSAACTIEPFCGDGNVDAGEACDDGNNDNGDGCDENCALEAVCGNMLVELGETCDDGNVIDADGCSATCQTEIAIAPRDQAIELAGSIDDQDRTWARPDAACAGSSPNRFYETHVIYNDSGADQTVRVTAAWGGDGYLHAYTVPFDAVDRTNCIEGNDDFGGAGGSRIPALDIPDGMALVVVASTFAANAAIGDYTIEVFTLAVCGDGDMHTGEECDDGNLEAGDGCAADCTVEPRCGDGNIDAVLNEECDDGNIVNGDGCDAICSSEFFENNLAITEQDSRMAAGSSDIWRFTLDGPGRIVFQTGDGANGCLTDTRARLYAVNEDGTRGDQVGAQIDGHPILPLPCASGIVTGLDAGVYEIEIAEQNDGAIAAYQMDLLVASDAAIESSNPGVLPVGGTDGFFFVVDDADTELALYTDLPDGTCPVGTDTELFVFTVSVLTGQLIPLADDDDGGEGACSRVQQVFQPGNYAVVVNEFGNNAAIEDYRLNVECVSCVNAARAGAGDLVITEIMKNPTANPDASGEYFEVLNVTERDLDVFGVLIRDNDFDDYLIDESVVIPAGGYATFGNGVGMGHALVYNGISLANGDDEVVLDSWRGIEIDRVEYTDAAFPDTPATSMQFGGDPLADDNNEGALWCDSTVAFGAGDLGSPGAANEGCEPPAPMFVELTYDNFDVPQDPVVITVGQTVRWTNLDNSIHTVTSGNPGEATAGDLFDSGNMGQGATFEHTFDAPGEFVYFCRPHAGFMRDYIVTVNAAP